MQVQGMCREKVDLSVFEMLPGKFKAKIMDLRKFIAFKVIMYVDGRMDGRMDGWMDGRTDA